MYNTPQVSTEVLNTNFCSKVFGGQIKEAMEAGSMYIRTRLYEDGMLRRLFEVVPVTADELDPELDSDRPSIICEIQPDAPAATFVPFKGTSDREYFNAKRFRVPFAQVESNRVNKNRFELETIRMPITEWLKEHQIKMIQEQEDIQFIDTVNDIVNKNLSGKQLIDASSMSFKDAFTAGMAALNALRVPQYKVLMNKNTYLESLKLKTDDIGFKPQEDRFSRGVDGEDSFLGLPVITSIKDDILKDGEMFFFSNKDFFCKFFMQQDCTLFLETRGPNIEFYTYESIGIGIGNTNGVAKVTWKG